MALKRRTWLGVVIVLAFLAAYFTALLGNITERSRRSLELRDEVAAADRALVSIQVIKIDPAARQLTARLRFRVYGDLAQDTMTPKLNLKLLTNNSPGQHVFEFPEGSGMVRIEATFPLEGDANRYPFDRYESTVLLFMDTPRPSNKPQAPKVQPSEPEVPEPQAPDVQTTADDTTEPVNVAAFVEAELRDNAPVPVSISVSASTPGMKYTGEVIRSNDFGAVRVHLNLQRPRNLINVSILVMCMMMGLALSILAMVITVITSRDKFDILPLSFAIALIFGLPALRSIQPNVPAVGALGDYISFIWAELFVAAGAIITALTWVYRTRHKGETKA